MLKNDNVKFSDKQIRLQTNQPTNQPIKNTMILSKATQTQKGKHDIYSLVSGYQLLRIIILQVTNPERVSNKERGLWWGWVHGSSGKGKQNLQVDQGQVGIGTGLTLFFKERKSCLIKKGQFIYQIHTYIQTYVHTYIYTYIMQNPLTDLNPYILPPTLIPHSKDLLQRGVGHTGKCKINDNIDYCSDCFCWLRNSAF